MTVALGALIVLSTASALIGWRWTRPNRNPAVAFTVASGYPEARLLAATAAFFALVIVVCGLLDRVLTAR
ncbi:hypothetical protein [Saccharopolyspora sp. NPDC002376]